MPAVNQSIFSSDFEDEPYWWEAFRPQSITTPSLPSRPTWWCVGGGYAGLATARALADRRRAERSCWKPMTSAPAPRRAAAAR